jgi:hypothetical protein
MIKPSQAARSGALGIVQIAVGLILLVLFTVVLVALFSSRAFQTGGQSQQPGSQSPSPSPTGQADPTTGWKIYTNADFSFSITYPSTWSFSEDKSDSTHQLPIVYFFDTTRELSPDSFEGISIQVIANPSNLDPKEWIKRSLSKDPIDPDKDLGYETLSIAGTQGLKVTGLPSRFGSLVVYIPHNSKVYVLSLEPFDKTNPKLRKDLATFEAMFHTLKFSD